MALSLRPANFKCPNGWSSVPPVTRLAVTVPLTGEVWPKLPRSLSRSRLVALMLAAMRWSSGMGCFRRSEIDRQEDVAGEHGEVALREVHVFQPQLAFLDFERRR